MTEAAPISDEAARIRAICARRAGKSVYVMCRVLYDAGFTREEIAEIIDEYLYEQARQPLSGSPYQGS